MEKNRRKVMKGRPILDAIVRYKLWIEIKEKILVRIAFAIFTLAILSVFNLSPALFNIIGLMIAYEWMDRK